MSWRKVTADLTRNSRWAPLLVLIIARLVRPCAASWLGTQTDLGVVLMFLHRAYFAQAMSEYPADPLNSPYGFSVSAAYRSATILLRDTTARFALRPMVSARVWRLWSFTFTASVSYLLSDRRFFDIDCI